MTPLLFVLFKPSLDYVSHQRTRVPRAGRPLFYAAAAAAVITAAAAAANAAGIAGQLPRQRQLGMQLQSRPFDNSGRFAHEAAVFTPAKFTTKKIFLFIIAIVPLKTPVNIF